MLSQAIGTQLLPPAADNTIMVARYIVVSVNPYCVHEAPAATIEQARELARIMARTPGAAVGIRGTTFGDWRRGEGAAAWSRRR